MPSSVMSVNDAASVLGVSPVRVRQLVRDGALPSERLGRTILLSAPAVRARAAAPPRAGRPLGPDMVWTLLRCLDLAATDDPAATAVNTLLRGMLDRRMRHRLKVVLSVPRDPADWARLLRPRASERCFWIHQGVIKGLLSDPRVHAGRAHAAASHGIAISTAGDLCGYVAEPDLPGLMNEYQLTPDEHGKLLVYVVAERASGWLPSPGEPVGAAAAAADMLDSDDARMRHAGAQWIVRNTDQILGPVTAPARIDRPL